MLSGGMKMNIGLKRVNKQHRIINLVRALNFPKKTRVRIRGLEMLVFGKFCVHTKWMIPIPLKFNLY